MAEGDQGETIKLDRTPTAREEAESTFTTPEERMLRENNRHALATQAAELGFMGKCFGGEKHAPMYYATVAGFLCLIIYAGCTIATAYDVAHAEIWAKQGERALAFAAAALSYIAGRGTRPSS